VAVLGIIGDTLRKAREDKGLSLQQVELETNMRWKYLEALEKEEYDVIPGQTYVKGFLRNYSAFLGLDCDYMLELYKQHLQEKENAKALEERITERKIRKEQKKKERSGKGVYLVVALLLIVVLGGGSYGFYLMGKPVAVNNPKSSGERVANETKNQPAPHQEPTTVDKTYYDRGFPRVNDQVVGKNTGGNNPVNNRPGGQESKPDVVSEGVYLTLNFTERTTWLKVIADGSIVFQGFAGPGGSKTFQASEKVWVRAGDAGAVEVVFNNRNLGKMGGPGQVVDREFVKPQESGGYHE